MWGLKKVLTIFFSFQKFSEAEDAFSQVLKLDKNCEDAVQELKRVRTSQITVSIYVVLPISVVASFLCKGKKWVFLLKRINLFFLVVNLYYDKFSAILKTFRSNSLSLHWKKKTSTLYLNFLYDSLCAFIIHFRKWVFQKHSLRQQ